MSGTGAFLFWETFKSLNKSYCLSQYIYHIYRIFFLNFFGQIFARIIFYTYLCVNNIVNH